MAIMTKFIDGQTPGIEDYNLCADALDKLHAEGVRHGDARNPNFVICGRPRGTFLIICFVLSFLQ